MVLEEPAVLGQGTCLIWCFHPRKEQVPFVKKGGFTGWKVGDCLKGLALYEKQASSWVF